MRRNYPFRFEANQIPMRKMRLSQTRNAISNGVIASKQDVVLDHLSNNDDIYEPGIRHLLEEQMLDYQNKQYLTSFSWLSVKSALNCNYDLNWSRIIDLLRKMKIEASSTIRGRDRDDLVHFVVEEGRSVGCCSWTKYERDLI